LSFEKRITKELFPMVTRIASLVRFHVKWLVLGSVCLVTPMMAQEAIPTANAMIRVTKKVQPEYPPAAKQLNVSGSQEVQITVSAAGDVEDAKVLKGNAMFTMASTNAVKQWKFQPLVKDGAAQRFTTVIIFNYQK
jgi:TonB family protein